MLAGKNLWMFFERGCCDKYRVQLMISLFNVATLTAIFFKQVLKGPIAPFLLFEYNIYLMVSLREYCLDGGAIK